jgi:hypothetical protein
MEPVNIVRARKDIAVPEKHLAPAAAFLEDPPAKGVTAIAPAALRAVRRTTRPQASCSSVTTSPRGPWAMRTTPAAEVCQFRKRSVPAPVAAMFRSGV